MMLARLSVVAVLVLVASASGALADGRVALVIGNSTYAHAGRLPNAENDATDMAAALRRLGFEVTTELDTDFAGLNGALRAFSRRSSGADVSLVFYAGHGMELDGVNHLLPVDARLEHDTDVRYETATLDDVLAATTGASLQVVILDACRDNPLARSIERTGAQRSMGRGSFAELSEDLLGNQTLVAYAAKAGTTAADGRGRNSPYTAALLEYLEQPLEIGMLFRRVRTSVLEATGGRQEPHEYHSLQGVEHYLGGRPVLPRPPPPPTENLFWQSIAESKDPADFEEYLRRFPDGTFAGLARNRLSVSDPTSVDPPVDVAQLDVAQLLPMAEQGDASAQTELGERYEDGSGVVSGATGAARPPVQTAAELYNQEPPRPVGAATDGAGAPTGLKYRILRRGPAGDAVPVDPNTAFRSGDRIRFAFEPNIDGFLYVLMQGTSGKWSSLLPHPQIAGGRNTVLRFGEVAVPPRGWFRFDDTPGTERVFVCLTREPAETLPGFGGSVVQVQTVDQQTVNDLTSTIGSMDLEFEMEESAAALGATGQAVYVVNPTGSTVWSLIELRHE